MGCLLSCQALRGEIIVTEGLLPGDPGKLWRTEVQQSFWLLLQPFFFFFLWFVLQSSLNGDGASCKRCYGLSPLQRHVVRLPLTHGLQCAMSSFPRCVSGSAGRVCSRLVKGRITFAFLALALEMRGSESAELGLHQDNDTVNSRPRSVMQIVKRLAHE